MEENDISDTINKFSDILKEKNINLNDYIDDSINNSDTNKKEENNNSSGLNIDMNTILKFKNIAEKMNNSNNPRSSLLKSLKPFLSVEKQKKIDDYIKISNILSILDILNKDIL